MFLRLDELHPGINILGDGSDSLAAVVACACNEAGLRTLVLDFGGSISSQAAGRIGVQGLAGFLYDSMRMNEKASFHAELAASAYTMALNLSFEQEAFLNSAIQRIALEQGVASPASLSDQLNITGEYRGHTADELKGKFGALRSLDVTGEAGVVKRMLERSSVASFDNAESPQAAEVATMLFLAKVLALGASGVELPDVLVMNEANRVFSNLPVTRHSNRLLTALLSSEMARILASETTYGLDHHFLDVAPLRILSSSLWNDITGGRSDLGGLYSPQHSAGRKSASAYALVLTPNLFALQDFARGYEEAFVPKMLAPLQTEQVPQVEPKKDDSRLIRQILEAISSYDQATRGSVVSYLSLENPREEVERAIDRLQSQGYLSVIGRDVKRGSPLHAVKLTQAGYDLMRRLS